MNCLHGDIGVIKNDDVISNSGNTIELVNIITYIKERTTNIIGIFSNPDATLLKYCSNSYILPKVSELDRFNLIRTSSIISFVTFSNVLISSLIEFDNIQIAQYGKNHPSGNIGNKILKCGDIMIKYDQIVLVEEGDRLHDCLLELCSKRLRCALVVDHKKNTSPELRGIITDGDIRRFLSTHEINDSTIKNCINKEPITINADDNLETLINVIKHNHSLISGIPVLNNGILVGLITQSQIITSI